MLAYWEDGPDGLTVAAASDRMGVSKPGLYREFGGEDGLIAASLERYEEVRIGPLLAALEVDRPFAESLERLAAWLGAEADTGEETMPAGCLLAKARTAARRPGPETRARLESMVEGVLAAYTALADRAVRRGETADGLDAGFAGRYLDTMITTFLNERARGVAGALVARQARLAFASLAKRSDGHGGPREAP